jgi:AcrR family transcriptional regulator
MGNREDLLAGAKRCLLEKGYSRTTARDIANASGVSLAAIGYHFGSKDTLLNQAMFEAMGEWGDEIEEAFRKAGASLSPADRFEAIWQSIIETFDDNRPLWLASFELIMQIDHIPGGREMFAQAMPMARSGLASLFLGVDEADVSPETAMSMGAVYYSLMSGLLVQRFADPENSPTPADLAKGLRAVADSLDASGGAKAGSAPAAVSR